MRPAMSPAGKRLMKFPAATRKGDRSGSDFASHISSEFLAGLIETVIRRETRRPADDDVAGRQQGSAGRRVVGRALSLRAHRGPRSRGRQPCTPTRANGIGEFSALVKSTVEEEICRISGGSAEGFREIPRHELLQRDIAGGDRRISRPLRRCRLGLRV